MVASTAVVASLNFLWSRPSICGKIENSAAPKLRLVATNNARTPAGERTDRAFVLEGGNNNKIASPKPLL